MMTDYRACLRGLAALLAPLLLVIPAAGVLMMLAYGVRPVYAAGMGDNFDRFYLTDGWHGSEQNSDFTFRWTTGYSTVHFPGIGRQPLKLRISMATGGSDPTPQKDVQITARGALVATFSVSSRLDTFEAAVSPDLVSRSTGDLDLLITSPSFQPKGDSRQLGVVVTSIVAESGGLAGLTLPPLLHLLYVAGMGVCIYLALALLAFRLPARLAVTLAVLVATSLVYGVARPAITFYAGDLFMAAALSLLALALAQTMVPSLYRRAGLLGFSRRSTEARALFALFVVGLFLAWAGLLYPQSDPHDFVFHLHRFQEVQRGTLLFQNYVVSGVGQGFYPPAMYVLLLPFSLLLRDPTNLVKLAPALFDFSAIFLVFYLAKRYFAPYRSAPLIASALYVAMPVNLLLVWWAHETNLFGLVALLGAVVYMLESYERLARPPVWLGLVVLLFIVLLSHPGVLVWSVVLVGALVLTFLGLRRFMGRGSYRSVGAIAAAFAVAGLLAFLLYYSHYVGVFGQAASTRPGSDQADIGGTLSNIGNLDDVFSMVRLTLYHGVLADYGLLPLLLAPIGLVLLFRRGRVAPQSGEGVRNIDQVARAERFRWTLLVWALCGLLFLLVSLLTALPLRPMLFFWPVVALLGGLALSAFIERGESGRQQMTWGWRRVAAGLLLAGLAGLSLYLWALANFLDLRVPHVYPLVF